MPRDLPSLHDADWLQQAELQALLHALAQEGGEGRVAGGAVRNALLGMPVADVDVATTLLPDRVTQICTARGFAVHPTGIDHGTVTVVINHKAFEVTTLRQDVKTDGRRATVAFTDDWQQDALRRDFTMNALYCDATGKIYDYTNGCEAIRKHRVRFVGTPSRRIAEDYLRVLRFFRFHALYGKGALDEHGLAACARHRRGLRQLSAERVTQELVKLLNAPRPTPVLQAMAKAGVLSEVIPHGAAWRHVRRLPQDAMLRLSMLLKDPANWGERLRLSNANIARLNAMASAPILSPTMSIAQQRRMLHQLGPQGYVDAARLSFARSSAALDDSAWTRLATLPQRWSAPAFPVNGKDLIAAGFAPGPELGETLRQLEALWIAKDFKPTRADLLAHAKTRGSPNV
jgi:poly(A) polymerase